MKIRQGFVSNSSSSSFIVAFPKNFKITEDNVAKYLFSSGRSAIEYYDHIIGTNLAVHIITEAMKEQIPNDVVLLTEAVSGWVDNHPNFDDFLLPSTDPSRPYSRNYDWDAYEKAVDTFRAEVLESLQEKWKDQDLFTFSFSDNDGEAALEHGGTFDAVPHMVISHH